MTYDELTHLSTFLKQLRSDCMSRHVESCDCVDGELDLAEVSP